MHGIFLQPQDPRGARYRVVSCVSLLTYVNHHIIIIGVYVDDAVFMQLPGGQRPGAAGLRAVQRGRLVLRVFRGDAGSAAHVGP